MTPHPSSEDIVRAVAAHGLRQRSILAWPAEPLPESEWKTLLMRVQTQRLEGFFAWASDSGFPITEEQAHELAEAHAASLGANLKLEQIMLKATGALRAAGMEGYVLKGPALARLLYPDPAVRLFGDLDLLIRSEHYDKACETFESVGYKRQFQGPRPGWDQRFTKGTVFTADGGLELDIHRTLALGPYGLRIVLEDVFRNPVSFRVADRELLALAPEIRFLHACFHAALGDIVPRLVPLRDIAEMLLGPALDFGRVDELIRRWRAEAVVARAIGLTVDRLGLPDLPMASWAERFHARLYDRIAMAAYVGPEDNNPRQQLLSVMGIGGFGPKVAYLRGLLFPKSDYLEGRHRDQWSRWRYAASSLLPHRRP
jgi:hypothetical protein